MKKEIKELTHKEQSNIFGGNGGVQRPWWGLLGAGCAFIRNGIAYQASMDYSHVMARRAV